MLLELHINNFALIDKLDISFSSGLNILTGETGAGKSIVIDSVNFILGEKQTRDIIRTGQESAYVEGVFDSKSSELCEILKDNGIEEEDITILSREITLGGRSIARINGRTVTLGTLKQVGRLLIDLHGQHEHQSLLDEEKHIFILDSFCPTSFKELKGEYGELYSRLIQVESQLQKLKTDDQYKLRRMDLISFQINEISDAGLSCGEDNELVKRKAILTNSEKIYQNLSSVYEQLYVGGDNKSAFDDIGGSIVLLEGISCFDDKLKEYKSTLEDVYYRMEDVLQEIRNYRDGVEYNQEELDKIEQRLDLINMLKRKYGNTIEDILKYKSKISLEMEQMERSEEIIGELEKEKSRITEKLKSLASAMTLARQETSEELKVQVENELKYLGMEKAVFKAEILMRGELNQNGQDDVIFLLTANPGEPLRPLSRVASGGEMSRIMLALKSVMADIDRIPTLIFDEIDTGISGRTAQAVGERMCFIARGHQLLCVTHLPQIAAMADVHFKIEKIVKNEVTTTYVTKLSDEEQIEELGRLLGGVQVTELTRQHAQEMKKLAYNQKNSL
jgi:DNA repair protein RecN (Recombination protein N)